MGQRSNILLRLNGNIVAARYFQWNFGERMVSRVAHTIDWFASRLANDNGSLLEFIAKDKYEIAKAIHIMETNFDMGDVVLSSDLITEQYEFEDDGDFEAFFLGTDNNDGYALIDISKEGYKYAFLHNNSRRGCDYPLSVAEYMIAEDMPLSKPIDGLSGDELEEAMLYNQSLADNVALLNKHASLMMPEEVEECLNSPIVRPEPAYIPNRNQLAVKCGNQDWLVVRIDTSGDSPAVVVSRETGPWFQSAEKVVNRLPVNRDDIPPAF